MQDSINAAWKQGSDSNGTNYYYNYVTGESRWEAPDEMTTKVVDTWLKQVDTKNNVYYYNTRTEESRWLPPCSVCGEPAERYCADCEVSFCIKHFEPTHIIQPLPDPSFANHIWSLVQYEKDILAPGDAYCIECKTKRCTRMCTTCWDGYCDVCYQYVHRVGALRQHQYINYRRAKKGWICIRALQHGDLDYYVHGTTGEVTYEKPEELMTDLERTFYTNFKAHREAAEKYTQEIADLQIKLEAETYAKDMLLYDSLTREEKAEKKAKVVSSAEVINEAVKGADPVTGWVGKMFGVGNGLNYSTTGNYRKKMAAVDDRPRGVARTKYIEELLASAEEKALDEIRVKKT